MPISRSTISTNPNISLFLTLVFVLVILIIVLDLISRLGLHMRRHVLIRERQQEITNAFEGFCYQPYAEFEDLPGLSSFPDVADSFNSALPRVFRASAPEIYHVIDDYHGDIHRTVFDLRTVQRGTDGNRSKAYVTSAFLIELPESTLTVFSLRRKGLANMVLWGEDPNIDVGDFVFSNTFELNGSDQHAVKALFDPSLISFFRANTNFFANGSLDVVRNAILFRYGQNLAPDEIKIIINILMKLITELSERADS